MSLLVGLLLAGCNEHGSGGGFPDGGGSGRACGGFAGTNCAANEFCDFGRDTCGAGDEQGICQLRPSGCNDIFEPVCGCDRVVHSSQCDAHAHGVDLDATGSCPVSSGEFACGFRTCNLETEYCQRGVSDVGGEPDSFECRPLPKTCSLSPSCGCTTQEPCGSFCNEASSGGLTLTCPGG
jgi:hypothetical protein